MNWPETVDFSLKFGPVAISIVAIFLSLRNQRIVKAVRHNTVRIDEFRAEVRDPIKACVSALSKHRYKLQALSRPTTRPDIEFANDCRELIPSLEEDVMNLKQELSTADSSELSRYSDWELAITRKIDPSVEMLEKETRGPAYRSAEIRLQLKSVINAIEEIRKQTDDRLRSDITRLNKI